MFRSCSGHDTIKNMCKIIIIIIVIIVVINVVIVVGCGDVDAVAFVFVDGVLSSRTPTRRKKKNKRNSKGRKEGKCL